MVSILIWAIIGAILGFYVGYAKRHSPKLSLPIGALVGVLVGYAGVESGFVADNIIVQIEKIDLGILDFEGISVNITAIMTLVLLALLAGILLPKGDFDEKVTAQGRITMLAYALTLPTTLIVFSIVIFPLIWNIIFSIRDIEVGDLRDVDIFDLSEPTLQNFENQVSLKINTVPCELVDEESGDCATDEEGNIIYQNPRRVYRDEWRGYQELDSFNFRGEQYAVGAINDDFYPMIFRTTFYTLSSTFLAIFFGLVAALLVRDAFPGRNIFRGFILFPYIAPVISVAFIWQALLRQNGLVNEGLGTDTNFLTTRDSFLGIAIPLITVIFFQTWRYFPFAFLFLLARLQAVPDDIYEAAKVDGAAPSQRLLFITIPQLRAVFGTLFLLRFIWTFNKFDDVYLLTGPIEQTKVIPVAIFEALFTNSNVGEASAIAVIMAIILAVVLAIYFRFFLVEES